MEKVSSNVHNLNNNFNSTHPKRVMGGEQIVTNEKKTIVSKLQYDKSPELIAEKTKNALETFNKIFKPTHLDFQLHEESGKYFVKVIDDQTSDVLLQIPSKDFLDMVAEAKEQLGLIVDKRI
jgi:flagellar protein FlaG